MHRSIARTRWTFWNDGTLHFDGPVPTYRPTDDINIATMPSPVSSVLLRIPTYDLPKLRDYFLAQDGGLTITQFIAVFVKLMGIQTLTELRETLPELLFFFDLVDINADGGMDFSEFVMFVIDEVAEQKVAPIMEKLQLVTKRHIQNASHAVYIRSCKRVPEVKAVVVAAGGEFHIYLEDPESPTLLKCACKYPLRARVPRGRRDPTGGGSSNGDGAPKVHFEPVRSTPFWSHPCASATPSPWPLSHCPRPSPGPLPHHPLSGCSPLPSATPSHAPASRHRRFHIVHPGA